VVETMTVDKAKMAFWCTQGFIGATSLLEQIAAVYHVPFRLAKMIVERGVKYSSDRNQITFEAIQKSLKVLEIKIPITKAQVEEWQDPFEIIKFTKSFGGPSLSANKAAVSLMKKEITKLTKWLNTKEAERAKADKLLSSEIATMSK